MLLGHSWADAAGIIRGIDEPVADLLQYRSRDLEGVSYLRITHPADHQRSVAHVAALRPGEGPRSIRKRYLTGGGGEVWVSLQVTRMSSGSMAGHMIGTFMVERPHDPRQRWKRATRLLELTSFRERVMGRGVFTDHAWTLMLHLYLAEAEGRVAAVSQIAQAADVSTSIMVRWHQALVCRGFAEALCPVTGATQLTRLGLQTFERLLDTDETR